MPSIHEKSFKDLSLGTRTMGFNSNNNSPRLDIRKETFSLPFIAKTRTPVNRILASNMVHHATINTLAEYQRIPNVDTYVENESIKNYQ
jgi:hypothetical protein